MAVDGSRHPHKNRVPRDIKEMPKVNKNGRDLKLNFWIIVDSFSVLDIYLVLFLVLDQSLETVLILKNIGERRRWFQEAQQIVGFICSLKS